MITENLSTLKIHKLTRAQYERELAAGRLDPNAIYLTPDDTNSDPSAVVTVDPTLSVSGQAADAKTVGDRINNITIKATDDNNGNVTLLISTI